MQIYDNKPKASPWRPKSKKTDDPGIVASAAPENATAPELEPEVPVDTKADPEKQSLSPESAETLAGLGSALGGIGAFVASSSQTAATACRMATSNPLLMGIGIAMIVIGFGAAIYFKYFQ